MVARKPNRKGQGRKPAQRRKPASKAGQRSQRLGPALAVVVVCGLLVGLNNAGLIPQEWTSKLVVGRERSAAAPLVEPEPEPRPADQPTPAPKPAPNLPVPAAKPPRPVRQQPKPDPTTTPQTKPETEPKPKPKPKPAVETPAAAPARRTDGVLTVSERRERLVDSTPPKGFTTEWSGGPAILRTSANELERGNPNRRRVALTMDGCFEADQVPAILEILKSQGVHVTFFLTGIFADKYPDAVKLMAAAGHEVGNHSWDHPEFTKLDDTAILSQLERTERELVKLAPRAYRPYFRPPFGDRDVRVLRFLIQQGFLPIYWTVDTLDWQPEATPESVLDKVAVGGLEPGAILLCHVASKPTLRALPRIIVRLRAANLEPGPLSSVLVP